MRGLKDKAAVVTGGLGDLGYAAAARLVEEGCGVAIVDARPDERGMAEKIGARAFALDMAQALEAMARGEPAPG